MWIPIEISLRIVPRGPINNILALVPIMAWRHSGDKPLSETMIALGLNELKIPAEHLAFMAWLIKNLPARHFVIYKMGLIWVAYK